MIYRFILLLLFMTNFAWAQTFSVGAYYETWSNFNKGVEKRKPFSLDQIDTSLINDLYFAFAIFGYITKDRDPRNPHLTGDYTLQPLYPHDEAELYPKLQELKKRSGHQLRLFLTVGGINFSNPNDPFETGKSTYPLFSRMISDPKNRQEFISSLIAYAQRHGFDGVEIDWEYPGDLTRGGSESDFENYPQFLKETSEAFQKISPSLILSIATPPHVPPGAPKIYKDNPDTYFKWLQKCSEYVDRMTIMAYNYHTPYDHLDITGVNAPLNRDTNPNSPYYIAKTLNYYLNNGIPAAKIRLGIPLFGWLYTNVTTLTNDSTSAGKPFRPDLQSNLLLPYFQIADEIAKKKFQLGIDLLTNTAYAYDLTNQQWISFDTPETVELKVKEAISRKLGGVNFWAINLDEYEWEPRFPNIRKASNLRIGH